MMLRDLNPCPIQCALACLYEGAEDNIIEQNVLLWAGIKVPSVTQLLISRAVNLRSLTIFCQSTAT